MSRVSHGESFGQTCTRETGAAIRHPAKPALSQFDRLTAASCLRAHPFGFERDALLLRQHNSVQSANGHGSSLTDRNDRETDISLFSQLLGRRCATVFSLHSAIFFVNY
tara:strand:- start:225 stop:551 length:327 start_codon:yes stop_codon:yes gene_type:complete